MDKLGLFYKAFKFQAINIYKYFNKLFSVRFSQESQFKIKAWKCRRKAKGIG